MKVLRTLTPLVLGAALGLACCTTDPVTGERGRDGDRVAQGVTQVGDTLDAFGVPYAKPIAGALALIAATIFGTKKVLAKKPGAPPTPPAS